MHHHPQTQKEHIHDQHHKPGGYHILLGIPKRFTTQVLLHHVLIKARHGDTHRGTSQKLLPEIHFAIGIPNKHIAHFRQHDSIPGRFPHPFLPKTDPFQPIGQRHNADQHTANEKYTLQSIRYHQRLDPAFHSIGQDQQDNHNHRNKEGHAHRTKQIGLKNGYS